MQDFGFRQPSSDECFHSRPVRPISLASAPKRSLPATGDLSSESTQCPPRAATAARARQSRPGGSRACPSSASVRRSSAWRRIRVAKTARAALLSEERTGGEFVVSSSRRTAARPCPGRNGTEGPLRVASAPCACLSGSPSSVSCWSEPFRLGPTQPVPASRDEDLSEVSLTFRCFAPTVDPEAVRNGEEEVHRGRR